MERAALLELADVGGPTAGYAASSGRPGLGPVAGPRSWRPYHPAYHPWTWRNWLDFGTGLLGDLGLHKLSTVFKALNLGHPVTVEASATKLSTETYPLGEIVRFEFPARGSLAPVTLTWYDGGLKPPRPPEFDDDDVLQDVVYIGEKGKLMGNRLIPNPGWTLTSCLPKRCPAHPVITRNGSTPAAVARRRAPILWITPRW